jgi:hypothetical protein
LHYSGPGKPQQKAFIDSFTRLLPYELRNQELFGSLPEARRKLEIWR